MTFGKVVAGVFFGSFCLVALAGAKPGGAVKQDTNQRTASLDACDGLKARMSGTADEMGDISSRAYENGDAIQVAGRARDLPRVREIMRSARADVWTMRSVVQKAKLQIEEAVENGCVTKAQTLDSEQKMDRMSEVGDETLAQLDKFDVLIGQ